MRPVTLISNHILNTGRIMTPSATRALRAPLRIQNSYLKNLPQLTISHLVTVEATSQNLQKLEDYIESNINSLDHYSLQFLLHNVLQMLAADTKDLNWITPSVAHHILKVSNNILNKVEFYADLSNKVSSATRT